MTITLLRALSLLSFLGLVGWVMAWIIVLGDVDTQHISLSLLLYVSPLLLVLFGVLGGRDKPLVYALLVSLPYTVHGGVVAWTEPLQRGLGLTEAALGLVFLFSTAFFIRARARAAVDA